MQSAEVAEKQAAGLLNMALIILDDAKSFLASAHVAHVLDILSKHDLGKQSDFPIDFASPQPTWGTLVDRH